MGRHPSYKKFLIKHVPEAFRPYPPRIAGKRVIIDGAQYAFVIRSGLVLTGLAYFNVMRNSIAKHVNVATDDAPSTVVLCLDGPCIPGTKSTEQGLRDSGERMLGREEYIAEVMENFRTTGVASPNVIGEGPLINGGEGIWRSSITRMQLTHFLTVQLSYWYRFMNVGTSLVLDEGIPYSYYELDQVRMTLAERMGIDEYSLQASTFDRTMAERYYCVELELSRRIVEHTKVITYGANGRYAVQTPAIRGEFDVKCFAYVPSTTDTHELVLIESQDSDMIGIATLWLLHHRPAYRGELWIDGMSPGGQNHTTACWRYIDVCNVLAEITTVLEQRFPALAFPIHTFEFLALCLQNDYTKSLPNVTNINILLDTLEKEQHTIGPLVEVTRVGDPLPTGMTWSIADPVHVFHDCTVQVFCHTDNLYRLYLRTQEHTVRKYYTWLGNKKTIPDAAMRIPDRLCTTTPDVITYARDIHNRLMLINRLRKERRDELMEMGTAGVNANGKRARIKNQTKIEVPSICVDQVNRENIERDAQRLLTRYTVSYPDVFLKLTYNKTLENYLSYTRNGDSHVDGKFNIMNYRQASCLFRSIAWTMNFVANPYATKFAESGFYLRPPTSTSHSYWGWDILFLHTPTDEERNSLHVGSFVDGSTRKVVYYRIARATAVSENIPLVGL